MKYIFNTALCLTLLFAAFSCKLEEIDSQPVGEPRLECDALESYTVQAAKPQAISFRVNATTPWTVSVSEGASWLTVSPASSSVSSLSEDVRISATANENLADRSAVITVKGENASKSYSIQVTQVRKGKLTVTPVAQEYEADGGVQSFSIESNLTWEVSAADSWLSFDQDKGDTDGSMKTVTVKATAAMNKSITRSTQVTVVSGDEKQVFTVNQKGQSLEFLPDQVVEVPRQGGEIMLNVKASMDWTVESDNAAITATREGSDKVKVSAAFNNIFAPRTARIILRPVSAEYGNVSNSIEVTQSINFKLDGKYEVLADGSVKLSCGAKSRVTTLDKYRFVNLVLSLGDVNFGDKGELWCAVNAADCNIYTQISLGGNIRIRQDGNLPLTTKPSGESISTYKNVNLSGMDKAALNAIKEYRFEVLPEFTDDPDYPGVKWHVVNFWYNGTLNTTLNFRSVFADDASAAGAYWFGFSNSTSDGTWYIVKTCDVTPLAE